MRLRLLVLLGASALAAPALTGAASTPTFATLSPLGAPNAHVSALVRACKTDSFPPPRTNSAH